MGDEYAVNTEFKLINGKRVRYNFHMPISEWLASRKVTEWVNSPLYNYRSEKIEISDAGKMWRLYSKISEKPTPILESQERRSFSKTYFLVAKVENEVIGGLWIEDYKGSEIMHIFKDPECNIKGVATTLESLMIKNEMIKGSVVNCNWKGEREKGQFKFFQKLGYNITCHNDNYYATKNVKK